MVVDVLECHWKANGHPTPLVEGHPKPICQDSISPNPCCFYNGDWANILNLARSFVLSKILLEYVFPASGDLMVDSTKCLMEAVAKI